MNKNDARVEEGSRVTVKVLDKGASARLGISATALPAGGMLTESGLVVVDGKGSWLMAGGAAASHLAAQLLRGAGKKAVVTQAGVTNEEVGVMLMLPPGITRVQDAAAPSTSLTPSGPAAASVPPPSPGQSPAAWLDIAAPGWRTSASEAIASLAQTDPAWSQVASALFGAAPSAPAPATPSPVEAVAGATEGGAP